MASLATADKGAWCLNKEKLTNDFAQALKSAMLRLLSTAENSDLVLISSDGASHRAHMCVLRARAPGFFNQYILPTISTNAEANVQTTPATAQVPDADSAALRFFLKCVYTDDDFTAEGLPNSVSDGFSDFTGSSGGRLHPNSSPNSLRNADGSGGGREKEAFAGSSRMGDVSGVNPLQNSASTEMPRSPSGPIGEDSPQKRADVLNRSYTISISEKQPDPKHDPQIRSIMEEVKRSLNAKQNRYSGYVAERNFEHCRSHAELEKSIQSVKSQSVHLTSFATLSESQPGSARDYVSGQSAASAVSFIRRSESPVDITYCCENIDPNRFQASNQLLEEMLSQSEQQAQLSAFLSDSGSVSSLATLGARVPFTVQSLPERPSSLRFSLGDRRFVPNRLNLEANSSYSTPASSPMQPLHYAKPGESATSARDLVEQAELKHALSLQSLTRTEEPEQFAEVAQLGELDEKGVTGRDEDSEPSSRLFPMFIELEHTDANNVAPLSSKSETSEKVELAPRKSSAGERQRSSSGRRKKWSMTSLGERVSIGSQDSILESPFQAGDVTFGSLSLQRPSIDESFSKTFKSAQACCSKLGRDLLRMLAEEIDADITIVTSGSQTVKAHKAILALHSSVWSDLFKQNVQPGFVVDLKDFSLVSVKFILNFLYGRSMSLLSGVDFREVLKLADQLGIGEVKQVVEYHLWTSCCHHFHKPCSGCLASILKYMGLMNAFNFNELLSESVKWCSQHLASVWSRKGFSLLSSDLHELCWNEVLKSFTPSRVVDVILACDQVRHQLPHSKHGSVVLEMLSSLHDAMVEYTAQHFEQIVSTERFVALGKGWESDLSIVDDVFSSAIHLLSASTGCSAFLYLDALYGVLLNDEAAADCSQRFIQLVRRLLDLLDSHLLHHASLTIKCDGWSLLSSEMQSRILQGGIFIEFKQPIAPPPTLSSRNRNFKRSVSTGPASATKDGSPMRGSLGASRRAASSSRSGDESKNRESRQSSTSAKVRNQLPHSAPQDQPLQSAAGSAGSTDSLLTSRTITKLGPDVLHEPIAEDAEMPTPHASTTRIDSAENSTSPNLMQQTENAPVEISDDVSAEAGVTDSELAVEMEDLNAQQLPLKEHAQNKKPTAKVKPIGNVDEANLRSRPKSTKSNVVTTRRMPALVSHASNSMAKASSASTPSLQQQATFAAVRGTAKHKQPQVAVVTTLSSGTSQSIAQLTTTQKAKQPAVGTTGRSQAQAKTLTSNANRSSPSNRSGAKVPRLSLNKTNSSEKETATTAREDCSNGAKTFRLG